MSFWATVLSWPWIVAAVLVVFNLVAFLTMGWDKLSAKRKRRRVPERTLWLYAIIFCGVGCTLGMLAFHHKSKKMPFPVFFPLLAAVQSVALYFFFSANWAAILA